MVNQLPLVLNQLILRLKLVRPASGGTALPILVNQVP